MVKPCDVTIPILAQIPCNGRHQRECEQRHPKKPESKTRTGLRIGCDTGWIVVTRTGN